MDGNPTIHLTARHVTKVESSMTVLKRELGWSSVVTAFKIQLTVCVSAKQWVHRHHFVSVFVPDEGVRPFINSIYLLCTCLWFYVKTLHVPANLSFFFFFSEAVWLYCFCRAIYYLACSSSGSSGVVQQTGRSFFIMKCCDSAPPSPMSPPCCRVLRQDCKFQPALKVLLL